MLVLETAIRIVVALVTPAASITPWDNVIESIEQYRSYILHLDICNTLAACACCANSVLQGWAQLFWRHPTSPGIFLGFYGGKVSYETHPTHPNQIYTSLYLFAAAFFIISALSLLQRWMPSALPCTAHPRPGLHTSSRNDLNISWASWAELYSLPIASSVPHRRALLMVYRV